MSSYVEVLKSYLEYDGVAHENKLYEAIDLKNVKIKDSIVGECKFESCVLEDMELVSTNLDDVLFRDTHLDGWEVEGEDIMFADCVFSAATINNSFFVGVYLNKCTFKSGVIISDTCFEEVGFKDCDFSDVRFEGCTFRKCYFEDCIFKGRYSYIDPKYRDIVEFKNCKFDYGYTEFLNCVFHSRTTTKNMKAGSTIVGDTERFSTLFTNCERVYNVYVDIKTCELEGLDDAVFGDQPKTTTSKSTLIVDDDDDDEYDLYSGYCCWPPRSNTHNTTDIPDKSKNRAYQFSTLGN